MRVCLLLAASLILGGPALVQAEPQQSDSIAMSPPEQGGSVATVTLDGRRLFRVRGVSAYPAAARARDIQRRAIEVAGDESVAADSGRIVTRPDRIDIVYGDIRILSLVPEDAALENVGLPILAETVLGRLAEAITAYRDARTPEQLLRSAAWLIGITVLAALVLWLVGRIFRWIEGLIERRVQRRIEDIEKASKRAIDAEQLGTWITGLLRLLRTLALIAVVLVWLNTALGLFPWTRPFAAAVFGLVLDPLVTMGTGLLNELPNIAFLVVLAFVVRFLLRATRMFFWQIHIGRVRPRSFEREWAMPTFRIVRVLIIAFAVVVAYPYIPGSGSEAFKGVSIFLGVIFSIGSSSFIANIIAGYSLTYRRAFRIGDRVKIGDMVGDVLEMRVLVTRLKSLKNEEINIPNAFVISSPVINYTSHQRDEGLVLHTEVGIGYDVPWRQVEAMLALAAERTQGLKTTPPPFVLQRELGDFAVTYELNAYCDDASRMNALYADLHRNIQDVFNEHGVQIMSPAYESDPPSPKIVTPDRWHTPPAKPPETGGAGA